MRITLYGDPRTKKNSQRLVRVGARMMPITSRAYAEYRDACIMQIPVTRRISIDFPVNVCCVYYMRTHRRVDLVNLLEATCDILVDARVVADDNFKIIAGHDGSRVLYDKERPRVDIDIDLIGG